MAKSCSCANVLKLCASVPTAQCRIRGCGQRWFLHASSGSRTSSSSSSNSNCSSSRPETPHIPRATSHAESPVDHLVDDDWLQRSRLLVGAEGIAKLSDVNVLLVGLGGVGSFAAEFLCRAGVGALTIVDGDTVDTTNRNRQLPALSSTVGKLKSEVVAARLRDINPQLQLYVQQEFLDPVKAAALVQQQRYHYVVDCIDSVAPKQALLLAGHAAGCHVVSSMGAGGRLDPSRVRLADISDTYNDAFAAVVRRGLRKAGVSSGITVVFSDELAKPASLALTQQQYKKSYFGTISYIPALFGLYIASHIIRHVVEEGYKLPKLPAIAAARSRESSSSSSSSSSSRHKDGSKKGGSRRNSGGSGQRRVSTSGPAAGSAAACVGEEQTGDSSSSGDSSVQQHWAPHAAVHEPTTPKQGVAAAAADVFADKDGLGQQQPQQNSAASSSSSSSLLSSFDRCQGLGIGYDGEGI